MSRLGTEQLHMCNHFTLKWDEEYVRSLSSLVWAIHKRLQCRQLEKRSTITSGDYGYGDGGDGGGDGDWI